MKKPIFLYSLLLLMLNIVSCSVEEPTSNIIAESKDQDIENKYNEITIDLLSPENNSTRSFIIGRNTTNNLDYDNCSSIDNVAKNIKYSLYYNNELIEGPDFFLFNPGAQKSSDNSDYIYNVEQKNNSISVSLRFLKEWDPSKIKIVLSTFIQNPGKWVKASSKSPSCLLYISQFFNTENNWETINKRFVLERKDAQIILLTSGNNYSIPDNMVSRTLTSIYYALNESSSIGTFQVPGNPTKIRYYSSEGGNYNCYKFNEDGTYEVAYDYLTATLSGAGWTSTGPAMGYFSLYQGNWDWHSTAIYKGSQYEMFPPFSIIRNNSLKEYPKKEDGTQFKYITIAFRDGTTEQIRWASIPLPEGGIEIKKRYIYILNNAYNLCSNIITRTEDNDHIINDFELIELDMDEPLPFELTEMSDEI